MAAAKQQLLDIFKEIKEVFGQHPSITVIPIKGDPPKQYEVKYGITGVYKDEGGSIQPSTSHIVTIAIPFGFPHFPPSCRPNTPIFHPDFDPSSICLGDFWQQDRSLAELIIHIGRMIAGEIYSRDNTFNEEAAAWYLANADKLPFARSMPSKTSETGRKLRLHFSGRDNRHRYPRRFRFRIEPELSCTRRRGNGGTLIGASLKCLNPGI